MNGVERRQRMDCHKSLSGLLAVFAKDLEDEIVSDRTGLY
jgi:hypothetical protein